MTIRITKDQQIGGVPARDVRDILKRLYRNQEYKTEIQFPEQWFESWLYAELYWLRVKGNNWFENRRALGEWLNCRGHKFYKEDHPDWEQEWEASRATFAAVLSGLVAEGFIELNKITSRGREMTVTARGKQFCLATLIKPVNRQEAAAKAAHTASPLESSPEANWLWGRIMDFEQRGYLVGDPRILFNAMDPTMRKDVKRIVPKLDAWLRKLEAGE